MVLDGLLDVRDELRVGGGLRAAELAVHARGEEERGVLDVRGAVRGAGRVGALGDCVVLQHELVEVPLQRADLDDGQALEVDALLLHLAVEARPAADGVGVLAAFHQGGDLLHDVRARLRSLEHRRDAVVREGLAHPGDDQVSLVVELVRVGRLPSGDGLAGLAVRVGGLVADRRAGGRRGGGHRLLEAVVVGLVARGEEGDVRGVHPVVLVGGRLVLEVRVVGDRVEVRVVARRALALGLVVDREEGGSFRAVDL